MADNTTLMKALRNADAAGDTAAATRIAGMIKAQGQPVVASGTPPAPDLTQSMQPQGEPAAVPWYTPITSIPGNAADVGMSAYNAITGRVGDIAKNPMLLNPLYAAAHDIYGVAKPIADNPSAAYESAKQGIYNGAGTPTRAWNTLATHPIDVLMAASGGLGQLGKFAEAGNMARTGGALSKAAEFTNPVNAVAKPIAMGKRLMQGNAPLKEAIKTIPDAGAALNDVRTQAKGMWDQIDAQDIKFPAHTFEPFSASIEKSFKGLDSQVAPQASALKNSLQRALSDNAPKPTTTTNMYGHTVHVPAPPDTRTVSFNTIDNIRKTASEISADGKLSNTERAAAGKILSGINEYYDTIPGLNEKLAPAKEMSRRKILAEKFTKMGNKAEWYTSGDESGLKNQVASFGKAHGETLTPEERSMFKNVVRKEGANSILSTAGGRLGQLFLGGVGGVLGGFPGMVLAGGGHLLARKFSEMITKGAIDDAMKTVLLGKEKQIATRSVPRRLPANDKTLIKALIAGRTSGLSTATQP